MNELKIVRIKICYLNQGSQWLLVASLLVIPMELLHVSLAANIKISFRMTEQKFKISNKMHKQWQIE